MDKMSGSAAFLKDEGNRQYHKGDYSSADGYYSKA